MVDSESFITFKVVVDITMHDRINKMTAILETPDTTDRSLYMLEFTDKNGETYTSYQNEEEFRLTKIRQKLYFELHVPLKLIEEIEESAMAVARRNDSENED